MSIFLSSALTSVVNRPESVVNDTRCLFSKFSFMVGTGKGFETMHVKLSIGSISDEVKLDENVHCISSSSLKGSILKTDIFR